jgi:hypothetical protein
MTDTASNRYLDAALAEGGCWISAGGPPLRNLALMSSDGRHSTPVTAQILTLAQHLADLRPTFFTKKGPGEGDADTNAYMRELRAAVQNATGRDYSEKRICGDNALAVDFFVEDEATVIEIALSLRNPNCELERDILKVLMAQELGRPIRRLIFLAKPGGEKRLRQPSSQAIVAWAARNHRLQIVAIDFRSAAVEPRLPHFAAGASQTTRKPISPDL